MVDNKAQCICPTCPNTLRPACASDDVQDLSECHLKRQACQGNINVTVSKQGPCGTFLNNITVFAMLNDGNDNVVQLKCLQSAIYPCSAVCILP